LLGDTLRALIVASVNTHADRVALWVDGDAYTYRYLYHQAYKISRTLDGLRPRRTAVLADRSFWSYAGILGAVLAGHAYVPLNPRHPIQRLADVLRRADVSAVIMNQASLVEYQALLDGSPRCQVVVSDCLPNVSLQDALKGLDDARSSVHPNDGAYLLFTSGSTGEPKGVMVSHGNVMTYLRTVIERYELRPEDRATQLFDLTFDLSVHDCFATWGSGGALYAPSETMRKAPRQFVKQHALTCWFSTPSTVDFMTRLRLLQPDDFPGLRLSLFCGELLPRRLVEVWRRAAPNSVIENLYGPTEATIAITAYRIPTTLTDLPDVIPIGTALAGQEATVMDTDLQPVAAGEIGELCLAGDQVTAGYWRRDDLTDERFVTARNKRWYRTGDRAMYDGYDLRFLGRIDRQVKISGHRVELLEVENVLREAAGCESVAAVAWPLDSNGLAHGIVAMVAPESHASADILVSCRQRLPPYMVPSRVVRLNWPLNTNGKTDYSALMFNLAGGNHSDGIATDRP